MMSGRTMFSALLRGVGLKNVNTVIGLAVGVVSPFPRVVRTRTPLTVSTHPST